MKIEELKKYASNLMFEMKEEEYKTLLNEFDVILKQMDIIDKFENIGSVEPMTFPFEISCDLRSDDNINILSKEEVLSNVKEQEEDQVKVPKVV